MLCIPYSKLLEGLVEILLLVEVERTVLSILSDSHAKELLNLP